MKTTKRRNAVVGVVAGLALGLGACGNGAGGEEDERTYVMAIGDDPMSLNVQLSSGETPAMFSANIMDTLIRMDDAYELSPGLAEDWELSDDGRELRLDLREGVTWHDGEPFTSEDVMFNLEEIIELSTFGVELAERIESVETPDEYTVVVRLSEDFGPTLSTLAGQYMLPKHLYEGTDYVTNEANMAPIGTGPMMFDSYNSGQQVVLVANPDYWEGEPQVDRAVFPIIPDADSRATALFAGELDRARIDPSQQERVAEDPNVQLLSRGATPQLISVMMNAETPELTDPAVRAAVFSAFNREAMVEDALHGLGTPATGFFPTELDWAVNPDIDFDELFPHDVDGINEALDEAGYPRGEDGTRFTLSIRYISELTEVAATAEMAQSMLGEVGIATELIGTSGSVYTEQVYAESDFDLSFLRSTTGSDPSTGIARWYVCNPDRMAATNPSRVCDDAIDEAAAGAANTSDQEERGEHFRALQERAAELIYYAPMAWYHGTLPTVNTTRWEGHESDQNPPVATARLNWLTMTLAE